MSRQPTAGETPGDLLLRTKLHAPAPRAELVPRSRLEARLSAGLRGKLTLIAAPAGFGKTTLIGTWRLTPRGNEVPLAWVSLDAGDNDPARFWSYVSAALDTALPGVGAPALAVLRAPRPPPIEAVLTGLLNRLAALPADAALVLDDYQVIEAAPIHQALSYLIEHLPPQLHLVIASRADPPLPLARLRARGDLTELRTADLRFTTAEVAAFLGAARDLHLEARDVAALEARTEGWIAGLQLAALALQGHGAERQAQAIAEFTGSTRYVADYLIEEVLARQSAGLQRFLLRTAILDRLCAPLCAAVLGASDGEAFDSQAALETLERGNLFLIPLDGERGWYRYHHLFAELLRHRLQRAHPDLPPELHRRASAWCEGAGLLDEAVRHALATADSALAAALIERHAVIMFRRSEIRLLRTWLDRLPEAALFARPRLTVAYGWTLALDGDYAAVGHLLARAAPVWRDGDVPPELVGELTVLEAGVARFQGDAPRAMELARRALEVLTDDQRELRGSAFLTLGVAHHQRGEPEAAAEALGEAGRLGDAGRRGHYGALIAWGELATIQIRRGLLTEATRACDRATELVARWGQAAMPAAGLTQVVLGEVLCERDDLDGATRALARGLGLLPGLGEPVLLARGHVALARVQQGQGDLEGALATIGQGEGWLAQQRFPRRAALARLAAYRARLWLARGDMAPAAAWAHECAVADEGELGYFQALTLVRYHLAQARLEAESASLRDALATLARLLASAETVGWNGHVIEILILEALVRQIEGDQVLATLALGKAVALAAPEGYARVFLDEGAPMMALLGRWIAGRSGPHRGAQEQAIDAHARHLQAVAARPSRPTAPAPSVPTAAAVETIPEQLSTRELAVLRLMADGYGNPAIAAELFVATSTVKWYVNSLFGKLAVTSRTQAVARARALGLLTD